MLKNYFKTAWRSLLKNKTSTMINILGLTIGTSVCIIIFLVTRFELSYDQFHNDKERIYRVVEHLQDPHGNKMASGIVQRPLAATLRKEVSGIESVVGFNFYYAKVSIPVPNKESKKFAAVVNGEELADIILTEPDFFSIFQHQWLAGDPATALDAPYKVVLTESEAHRYFGQQDLSDIMGQRVIYDDSLVTVVSGIVKDWDHASNLDFKDFISASTIQASFLKNDFDLTNWNMLDFSSQAFVKLGKGINPSQVEAQFPAVVRSHISLPQGVKSELNLQPLNKLHFDFSYMDSYTRRASLPGLYGMMGLAVFILLIAIINFINLSTARSLHRAKEVGVRKVLGSSRASLKLQFLTETFIITVFALIISVSLVKPLLAAFHSIIPEGVGLDLLRPQTILFLLAVLAGTTLLAGFYPAKVLSSYLPALSLKGASLHRFGDRNYLKKALIIFQFTTCLGLIIGTIVITDQMHYVMGMDLGFTKDAIVTVKTPRKGSISYVNTFADKLRQLPGIELVSMHMETPAAKGHPGTEIIYHDSSGEHKVNASFDMCDENYVPLFGMKVIAGRNIQHSDTIKEYLINETCARQLGFLRITDALGKFVQTGMSGRLAPIVGVIRDFHAKSLHEQIPPFFLGSILPMETTVSVRLKNQEGNTSQMASALSRMESSWSSVYQGDKFEYRFFDQTIARFYENERKSEKLMNIAMVVAILLSCMGLFGLTIYTTQQRMKEIGIRKVLGATAMDIVSMLSADLVWLVVIAILIASPVAYYFMHRWLQDFVYRVPMSWWMFALAGGGAVAIALLTVSWQAIRAATANPVDTLRTE